MSSESATDPTLEEERQALVRKRILRAALSALRDVGANVSVEEIAARAGTSRRTVFRYYPTREDLIAASLGRAFEDYVTRLTHGDDEVDLDEWLDQLVTQAHTLNASLGVGYWQLLVTPQYPGPVADVLERRREQRAILSAALAKTAWRLAGRSGRAPHRLVAVFSLLLSPLSTATIDMDITDDPVEAARLTVSLLRASIDGA